MAISLKSIDNRLTELEKYSTWSKGANAHGSWIKENTSGLIIQYGRADASGTRTLPIEFQTSYVVSATRTSTSGNESSIIITEQTSKTFKISYVWVGGGITSSSCKWIAIGYLISDRILNYIYIAIFVHIFLIFFSFFKELNKEV